MIRRAKDAYFESLNGQKVREIENRIENGIDIAIKNGKFSCTVCPFTQMSDEVKARIIEDLTELGYIIRIDDNAAKYGNAPSDQRPWYDDIHISWDKIGEDK